MLHKGKVAIALWGNAKRQVRIFLRLKPRARVWPPDGFEPVLQHHAELVKRFLKELPEGWDVRRTRVARRADSECLVTVWPGLRKTARLIPRDELAVLEAVVVSHKG